MEKMNSSHDFSGFRLNIHVPPSFAGIPLTGEPEQVDAHIRQLAERMTETTGEGQVRSEESLRETVRFLAQRQIRLFGRFAAEDDTTDGPVLADLALTIPQISHEKLSATRQNHSIAAAKLVEQYKQRHEGAEAEVVNLISGPGLIGRRRIDHHPPSEAGYPDGTVIPKFRTDFQIPSPTVSHIVIMTATTNSESGWDAVTKEAAQIANTIRFEEVESSTFEDGGNQ